MPAPFKVKAVYEYQSDEPDDLNFEIGQIITVTEEEDAEWYTGEYVTASGEKREGLFPRNFVEKFEPAVPSRPARAPKQKPAPEPAPAEPVPEPPPPVVAAAPEPEPEEPVPESEPEPPKPVPLPPREEPAAAPVAALPPAAAPEPTPAPAPAPAPAARSAHAAPAAAKPAGAKAPPPVAEKPTSSSFRDRIAAFNKPAAAPITPFKPGGGGSTGFVKRPFVAPPPSKNAYVPLPRDPPPQKVYRREEEPSYAQEEERQPAEPVPLHQDAENEDQPKPTSLKERIALLQKQQMEQAARHAEKKDKPKRPPKQRAESSEEVKPAASGADPPLSKVETNETIAAAPSAAAAAPASGDLAADESETPPAPPRRQNTTSSQTAVQPSRELVSDTNDADDSGAGDEEDAPEVSTEEERPKSKGHDLPATVPPKKQESKSVQDEDDEDEDDEEEEEEEDPEVRRKRELRERMAKMSGGMGMMGMFGPPGGMPMPGPPRKPKPPKESGRVSSEQTQPSPEEPRPAPVALMALPGMSPAPPVPKRQEEEPAEESDNDDTAQPTPQEHPQSSEANEYVPLPPQRRSTERSAPPTPQDRQPPPAPPREARAAPAPPPGNRSAPPPPQSPTSRPLPPPPPPVASAAEAEPEGDTEYEADVPTSPPQEIPTSPKLSAPPPPPPARSPTTPQLDTTPLPTSQTVDKRASRPPPPIPMSPTSPVARAPPPPPPGMPPSRRSTSDSHGLATSKPSTAEEPLEEDEVTEYDGDYDTDIASGVKHKDALKSHNRDSSIDDGALTDDATKSPKTPPVRSIPPLPPVAAPAIPPPPPRDAPPTVTAAAPVPIPKSRGSVDTPRTAPPPVPPPKLPENEEEYDPYRYAAPQHAPPPHPPPPHPPKHQYNTLLQSPSEEPEEDDMYSGETQATHIPPPMGERSAPPPPPMHTEYMAPPSNHAPPPPPPTGGDFRQSLDVKRSGTVSRRSVDQARATGENAFIAQDIDLGKGSFWWTQENLPPPSLQGRPDVLFEIESSTSTKRGGQTTVSKDIYVLYMDYSQTTINAHFDAADPSHVTFEQNHQRPPPTPRRDQLEASSSRFGAAIARAASGTVGSSIADGSARAFVDAFFATLPGVLRPIGTRAYGALVYANLGNASTQQYDEIRPGDIVTFRNAKFSGHKGGLHSKYSQEAGKPGQEHVAVVIDWDGTKKKIRAWEQAGGEKGKRSKVREESYRMGDLKTGEVMVWRVMGRTWVGWDGDKQ